MTRAPVTLSPDAAARLCEAGEAVLVDVREADENARERIRGAVCLPLSAWDESPVGSGALIFHCRSGARTASNAARLMRKTGEGDCYILEGGIDGWKRAGLPVERDLRQPLELQRQVQIAAGSIAAIGTALGVFVSPWFLIAPAFVGAGLTVAGLTGFCGMARLLMAAPWNRAMARG
jgi:rhodanese-related sulfurtransferase